MTVTGIILAGGKNIRFGRAKSLEQVGDVVLIERVMNSILPESPENASRNCFIQPSAPTSITSCHKKEGWMPINAADTAWVLISAAMVMLMTPGVAFFYGGMVRRKNFLSTLMMSLVTLGLIGLLWVLYGYSLSFGPDKYGINGGLNFIGLIGVGQDPSKGASQIIGANKEEEIIAYVIGTIFLL